MEPEERGVKLAGREKLAGAIAPRVSSGNLDPRADAMSSEVMRALLLLVVVALASVSCAERAGPAKTPAACPCQTQSPSAPRR
jgi:hypothetical protein